MEPNVAEPARESLLVPTRRLEGELGLCVVPLHQSFCFGRSESISPTPHKPVGMRRPDTRHLVPDTCQFAQRMVHVTGALLADSLSGKFDRRRDSRMRRHARQPAQLIGAEAKDVVKAGIGAVQLQRAVELALAAEHAGRELVRESAVALGEPLEVAVAGIGEGRAGADFAENLQSRPASGGLCPYPASPPWGGTASRLLGAASRPRERPAGPPSAPRPRPAASRPGPA